MAINSNSIDRCFESPEYNEMLKKISEDISNGIDFCKSEADIIKLFEMNIYHHIRNLFNLSDEDVRPSGEVTHTDGRITHKFIGRMDSLYTNSFCIEYKHFDKLKTPSDIDKAIIQTVSYLTQLHDDYMNNHKDEDNINCAILTDGKKVMFFYYYKEKLVKVPFRPIAPATLDIIVRRIVYKNKKPFITQNIAEDFSVCRGNTCAKSLAQALFMTLKDKITNTTESIMKEWEVLFHLSESDAGQSNDIRKRREALSEIFEFDVSDNTTEYKALYALQTTYSIIVKLIAVKTLSYLIYDKEVVFFENLVICSSDKLRRLLCNIEDGYNVSLMNVKNLVEGDFFTWYCYENQWNKEIYDAVFSVIQSMEQYASLSYSTGEDTVDIFRELYMEVMPNAVRHSLGEYYTSAWLADNVVKNATDKLEGDDWIAIDPCCGSGVFITRLIQYILPATPELYELTKEDKIKLLNDILSRVKGVDINPISVLTARVNYFLCILPLLKSIGDTIPVTIPVYLGDSANPVNIMDVNGVTCNTTTIMVRDGNTIDICLPTSFVSSEKFYDNMHKIQLIMKQNDAEVMIDMFKSFVDSKDLNEEVIAKIEEFCCAILEMNNSGTSVNWLRIATNYLAVSNISNISLIIGNPPWVKWEHLPQKYAEKIKAQCVKKHLFSGQSYMGAIQLNICALIADMTVSHWLKDDGILAFLMPKTMLTQDSYAGFRNFYIDYENDIRMYLYKIDDWSKAGDPFIYTTEKFATYYYSRNYVDYKKGVPVSFAKKVRGVPIEEINIRDSYNEVEEYFEWTDGVAVQLGKDRTGFTLLPNASGGDPILDVVGRCDYKARTGVEFTPSEVYWLKYNEKLSSDNNRVFENIKLSKAIHKAVTNSAPFSLESKYVFPLVLGPSIGKYSINYKKEYCIFPYYLSDEKCMIVDEKQMCLESPLLYEYLSKNDEVIDGQSERSKAIKRGDASYALSKVGPYTFSDVTVAFRDNTCMSAVVLTPTDTQWGEKKQFICAKHAPFITVDKDDNYISEDEGYYIAAILNTKVVERYFKSTYSGRSYSIKNINVYMPKYDSENKSHVRLSELSRIAHHTEDAFELESIISEVETIYRGMCLKKNN